MHGCRRSSSRGGGGCRTVQVRGYTRANGTYVAGYTRSMPRKTSSKATGITSTPTASRKNTFQGTTASSPAASSSGKTVYVRGYTRANGTYVAGYYRSPPSSKISSKSTTAVHAHNSASTCSSPASFHWPSSAKTVHVTGYTKSNGTCAASHHMHDTTSSPRMTIKAAQLMPVLPTSSAHQSATTSTADTQVTSKHTKPESTKKVEIQPPVHEPDTTKPTNVVKGPTKVTFKQSPPPKPAKPCNAIPTVLVKVEAKDTSKQRPHSRPDSVKTADLERVHVKETLKQHSTTLNVRGNQLDCYRTTQEVVQGSISLLTHDSSEFSKVAEKFRKAWAWEKRPYPAVNFIFEVSNNTLEQKWTAYRRTLLEKDIKEFYHGTKLSCKITTTQNLCNIGSCGICGISSSGLDPRHISRDSFQRFGLGFYLAHNSSKSHDYSQSYDGFKAMLMCDVLPGRKYVVQTNRQHLQGPPTGYDSVYGNVGKDLNYPELVIYKPEAVLPRYIIVYRSR